MIGLRQSDVVVLVVMVVVVVVQEFSPVTSSRVTQMKYIVRRSEGVKHRDGVRSFAVRCDVAAGDSVVVVVVVVVVVKL
ncbi:hypothetical protein E2C01_075723 [Portunus trituberculatus]|uniref:Secreted protein n=1 Tax=Portunus trituberculatus TaxID=210409 RepID=A0A5B7IBE3_PORTR|nr:hypothetical protein [Portunus trituberculatus]